MELENKVSEQINDIKKENLEKLAQLFPSIIKDGQVDFKALKEELGEFEEVKEERYEFTWAGKQNAKKKVQEDVGARTLKYIEEDSKNPDTTENLYIEGDNLEVLKLLRQNYYGSIKMIYIDPPYNTGKDFIYNDNFKISDEESAINQGYITKENERLEKNTKDSNRFHAKWLNEMYPRLKMARDLLTDDGIIIINIDEHEIINLQKILDEIFGELNNLGNIIWDKRNPKGDSKGIASQHEYILFYTKNKEYFLSQCQVVRPKKNAELILKKAKQLFNKINLTYSLEQANKDFSQWINLQTNFSGGEKAYNKIDENGEVYRPVSMAWPNKSKAPDEYFIPLIHPITKKECPIPERGWRNPRATMELLLTNGLILFGKDETTQPTRKYLLKDNMYENISSLLYYGGSDIELLKSLKIPFDTPKVLDICKEHILAFSNKNDIILDFFSGSATTAHAVMQLNAEDGGNRKYIMVQLNELTYEGKKEKYIDDNGDEKERYIIDKETGHPIVANDSEARKEEFYTICEIGKKRIRRAGELIKKEIEESNKQLQLGEEPKKVPDIGFKVFRTADTNINWKKIKEVSKDNVMKFDDPDILDFTLGFNDKDVVYEVLLRQRDLPLSEKLVTLTDIGSRTYLYADSYLVCLETNVTEELIEKLAELNPLPIKFIFRDSAFGSKIGLKEETFRKLKTLVEKNSGLTKKAYTVEFI
jgi:adenine-specific DNA-methyltransferase